MPSYPYAIMKPIINIIGKISLRGVNSVYLNNNVLSIKYKNSEDAENDFFNFEKKIKYINDSDSKIHKENSNQFYKPMPDPIAIELLNEYDENNKEIK